MKSVEEKKKERKLNKGQVAVLKLLYRYRFTTSELLAKAEGQKHLQVTRSRLEVLEKQGYIHRRYDNSYKLRGRFAAYCLTAKGLSYLKSIDVAEPQIIKMMYNDPKASEKFVDLPDAERQFRAGFSQKDHAFPRMAAQILRALFNPFPFPAGQGKGGQAGFSQNEGRGCFFTDMEMQFF